jgi:hypothetical protein
MIIFLTIGFVCILIFALIYNNNHKKEEFPKVFLGINCCKNCSYSCNKEKDFWRVWNGKRVNNPELCKYCEKLEIFVDDDFYCKYNDLI